MAVNGHIRAIARSLDVPDDACTVQAELSAMQLVASALGALDAATQARVLQWAAQRFQVEQPLPPPARLQAQTPPAGAPEPGPAVDEALSVSTLDDLFGSSTPGPIAATAEPPAQPVAGMLHEFVVEFQNIAREWSEASDAPSDMTGRQRASSDV